jgi:hypothetical protein
VRYHRVRTRSDTSIIADRLLSFCRGLAEFAVRLWTEDHVEQALKWIKLAIDVQVTLDRAGGTNKQSSGMAARLMSVAAKITMGSEASGSDIEAALTNATRAVQLMHHQDTDLMTHVILIEALLKSCLGTKHPLSIVTMKFTTMNPSDAAHKQTLNSSTELVCTRIKDVDPNYVHLVASTALDASITENTCQKVACGLALMLATSKQGVTVNSFMPT